MDKVSRIMDSVDELTEEQTGELLHDLWQMVNDDVKRDFLTTLEDDEIEDLNHWSNIELNKRGMHS